MNFGVGDVVVCIDDYSSLRNCKHRYITEGHRYRVSGLIEALKCPPAPGAPGVYLEGVPNPWPGVCPDTGFQARRFRKLEGPDERITLSQRKEQHV